MSRYITTLIIFILTVTLSVYGYFNITNRCKVLSELADEAEYFIENEMFKNAEGTINEALDVIKRDKRLLLILMDKDVADKLGNKLHRALVFIKNKEKTLALSEITEAREIVKDIYKSQLLTVENIL